MFNDKRNKKRQHLLLWSVVLNFVLISIIIVVLSFNNILKNSFRKKFFILKSSLSEDREVLLNSLSHLHERSLSELSQGLLEKYGVIYGKDFRFFILGELVLKFDIDLSRALERPVEFVYVKIGSETIPVPSQCSEIEFKKVFKFLKKEKYPFTARGILNTLLLQLKNNDIDEDLLSYFMHSEEFQFFSSILEVKRHQINPALLLRMIIEGGSYLFFEIASKNNMKSCNPQNLRREALFSYIEKGFSMAAELFIVLDMNFLIYESKDQDLKRVLKLISTSSHIYEKFLTKVIQSSREENIRMIAEDMLSRYPRYSSKDNFKIEKSLFPEFRNNRTPNISSQPFIEHMVVSKESLWEISKRYKVSIIKIMEFNQLSSAVLYPGQKLKIPLD